MRIAVLITVLALPAAAETRETQNAFHGTWGSAAQCARAPLIPGGSVTAEPFEIDREWLRHGQVWCQLSWTVLQTRDTGTFTAARAQCGEDAVQDYFLRMDLSDSKLTLRWDVFHANGPLERCSAP